MRVVISTLMHGRHETTLLCHQKNLEAGISDTVCCYSSPNDKSIAEKISILQIVAPNNIPVKAQASVSLLRKVEYDAVMLMGCDDYINRKGLDLVKELLQEHDYIAFLDMYFDHRGIFYLWPGYPKGRRYGEPGGAGKTVRKDLLEAMNYTVFTTTQNGATDLNAHTRLMAYAKSPLMISCVKEGVRLVDVKDQNSTTPIKKFGYLRKVVI